MFTKQEGANGCTLRMQNAFSRQAVSRRSAQHMQPLRQPCPVGSLPQASLVRNHSAATGTCSITDS